MTAALHLSFKYLLRFFWLAVAGVVFALAAALHYCILLFNIDATCGKRCSCWFSCRVGVDKTIHVSSYCFSLVKYIHYNNNLIVHGTWWRNAPRFTHLNLITPKKLLTNNTTIITRSASSTRQVTVAREMLHSHWYVIHYFVFLM